MCMDVYACLFFVLLLIVYRFMSLSLFAYNPPSGYICAIKIIIFYSKYLIIQKISCGCMHSMYV